MIFVIMLVFGTICAAIASSKGRSAVGFFFLGAFFPLIGLIVVLVVGNLKEEQRHREHAAAERRRLREQLQQEKMKTEAFRAHAAARLDTHDRALNMDTRNAVPLSAGGGAVAGELSAGTATPPPLSGSSGGGASSSSMWHYEVRGQQKGPVPLRTLQNMLSLGTIAPTNLVWTQGMAEWVAASDVPELRT